MVIQSDTCPYCGERMEPGGIVGGRPLWWFSRITGHSVWRLKYEKRKRLNRILGPWFLYGYECSRCNISIVDLRDPNEVDRDRASQQ
ncbi:MAG: PF20097 family protein [Candidatus Thorarchaeota archaeon]